VNKTPRQSEGRCVARVLHVVETNSGIEADLMIKRAC